MGADGWARIEGMKMTGGIRTMIQPTGRLIFLRGSQNSHEALSAGTFDSGMTVNPPSASPARPDFEHLAETRRHAGAPRRPAGLWRSSLWSLSAVTNLLELSNLSAIAN